MLILAEVSDKMMSYPTLFAWVVGLVAASWALMRKKKWLVVVTLPIALLFASVAFNEGRDPYVGQAIIHELGYAYLALACVPLVAIAVFAVGLRKSRANQSVDPTPVNAPRSSGTHS